MKLLTVTFKLHNDQELVATDVQDASGQVVRNGKNAFEQFKHGEVAKVVTGTGDEYYVPFHAVIWVKVESAAGTVTPVDDDNCNYNCNC